MEQRENTFEAQQKYSLGEKISSHQNREVFLAQNAQGQEVVLKRLRMGQLSDWKPMELFEREARTLQTLRHPRIPQLLDFFHEEQAGQITLTMVMECIAGPSLAQRLQQGWRPKEAEVIEIARQGLEILHFLHNHQPPVIHRDIKPSNLIWTDSQELYLIDFGAVRDIFISKGSSTVIGTFGYMAPEQFAGQTVPASDLYGLGATLLHLLSGRSPSEIPQKHLMPDFRPYVTCSVEMQRLLEHLLVPDLEERLPDAQAALEQLKSLTKMRELSPSGRMVYLRDGEDVSIALKTSLNPIALCQQHKGIMAVVTGFSLMNLGYLYLVIQLFGKLSQNDWHSGWSLFMIGYGVVTTLVTLAAVRQLFKMARERFQIQLGPTELIFQQLSPQTQDLTIPRTGIAQVNRRVTQTRQKLTRSGVSLKLDLDAAPSLTQEQLDIAIGLSKRDQHWLMTKLLQYTYTPGDQSLPPSAAQVSQPA